MFTIYFVGIFPFLWTWMLDCFKYEEGKTNWIIKTPVIMYSIRICDISSFLVYIRLEQEVKPCSYYACHEYINITLGLDKQKKQGKIVNIFLPIIFSICFGCSKEPSNWDDSLSTHNICFGWEIRKLFFCYPLLTKVLILLSKFWKFTVTGFTWKITKLPSKHSMLGHHWCNWILSPFINLKKKTQL